MEFLFLTLHCSHPSPPSLPPSRMFPPSWWPRPCPCPWRSGATGSSAHAQSTPWPSRPRPNRLTGTTPSPSGARSSSSVLLVRNTVHTSSGLSVNLNQRGEERGGTMGYCGGYMQPSEVSQANLYWVEWRDRWMERWRRGWWGERRIKGRSGAVLYISGCRGHRVQHRWLEA